MRLFQRFFVLLGRRRVRVRPGELERIVSEATEAFRAEGMTGSIRELRTVDPRMEAGDVWTPRPQGVARWKP